MGNRGGEVGKRTRNKEGEYSVKKDDYLLVNRDIPVVRVTSLPSNFRLPCCAIYFERPETNQYATLLK